MHNGLNNGGRGLVGSVSRDKIQKKKKPQFLYGETVMRSLLQNEVMIRQVHRETEDLALEFFHRYDSLISLLALEA